MMLNKIIVKKYALFIMVFIVFFIGFIYFEKNVNWIGPVFQRNPAALTSKKLKKSEKHENCSRFPACELGSKNRCFFLIKLNINFIGFFYFFCKNTIKTSRWEQGFLLFDISEFWQKTRSYSRRKSWKKDNKKESKKNLHSAVCFLI